MGRVETFDHTADLGLRVEAESLSDLFETAARGLFGIIVANLDAVRPLCEREIALERETTADLLVTWLSELIFLSESEHTVFSRFQVQLDADSLRLHARVAGEPIDPSRHVLDHEVKAVTLHGLSLEYRDQRWFAELILDI